MQIINEVQLDFSDVLMKPKRSTILSRKDANIEREYKYKWCKRVNYGTGIFNANMGTVGNFGVANKMLESNLFATLHKHYTVEQLIDFFEKSSRIVSISKEGSTHSYDISKCFISIGLKDDGLNKLLKLEKYLEYKNQYTPSLSVCIDVPNGYIPSVKDLVKKVREYLPNSCIMVGNVVTGDITEDLILSGADIIKIGIGPGCFVKDTKIQTSDGLKNIQDIKIGDKVLTHKGIYENVTNTFIHHHHKKFIKINDIECTPDHKFYVIEKKDKNLITEKNLNEYAKFIEAKDLDVTKHLLIKIIK